MTCNYSTRSNPVTFALGGTTYGQPTLAGDCYGQCFTDVDCRFTPAAGRYQVVIGVLKGTDAGIGAVIVTNVTGGGTPAPPTNLHITS